MSQAEIAYLENLGLQKTEIEDIQIQHKIHVTMIDGKVHTAISEGSKSYQVCTICNLGPKDLNDFDKCKASANLLTAEAFKRSISVLHAWIRSMEYMLNLAYRLVQVYFNNYTFYTDSR